LGTEGSKMLEKLEIIRKIVILARIFGDNHDTTIIEMHLHIHDPFRKNIIIIKKY